MGPEATQASPRRSRPICGGCCLADCHSLRRWIPTSRSAAPLHTSPSTKKAKSMELQDCRIHYVRLTGQVNPPCFRCVKSPNLLTGGLSVRALVPGFRVSRTHSRIGPHFDFYEVDVRRGAAERDVGVRRRVSDNWPCEQPRPVGASSEGRVAWSTSPVLPATLASRPVR